MIAAFEATTNDMTVRVRVEYLHQRSVPDTGRFVWAYHITIINHGAEPVQLLRRSWEITDAEGYTQLVNGEGVVGKQPILPQGGAFSYSSGVPLGTPNGYMVGVYHMSGLRTGRLFNIAVPAFSLESPL